MTRSTSRTSPARPLAPEVQPSSLRPSWTAAQKLAILAEYESYPRGAPERGALLRREGIYTSHISKWRHLRDQAATARLTPQPRGPKPALLNPLADENTRLQNEVARLQARLSQAEAVIEIQKKVALLLGTLPPAATLASS